MINYFVVEKSLNDTSNWVMLKHVESSHKTSTIPGGYTFQKKCPYARVPFVCLDLKDITPAVKGKCSQM